MNYCYLLIIFSISVLIGADENKFSPIEGLLEVPSGNLLTIQDGPPFNGVRRYRFCVLRISELARNSSEGTPNLWLAQWREMLEMTAHGAWGDGVNINSVLRDITYFVNDDRIGPVIKLDSNVMGSLARSCESYLVAMGVERAFPLAEDEHKDGVIADDILRSAPDFCSLMGISITSVKFYSDHAGVARPRLSKNLVLLTNFPPSYFYKVNGDTFYSYDTKDLGFWADQLQDDIKRDKSLAGVIDQYATFLNERYATSNEDIISIVCSGSVTKYIAFLDSAVNILGKSKSINEYKMRIIGVVMKGCADIISRLNTANIEVNGARDFRKYGLHLYIERANAISFAEGMASIAAFDQFIQEWNRIATLIPDYSPLLLSIPRER